MLLRLATEITTVLLLHYCLFNFICKVESGPVDNATSLLQDSLASTSESSNLFSDSNDSVVNGSIQTSAASNNVSDSLRRTGEKISYEIHLQNTEGIDSLPNILRSGNYSGDGAAVIKFNTNQSKVPDSIRKLKGFSGALIKRVSEIRRAEQTTQTHIKIHVLKTAKQNKSNHARNNKQQIGRQVRKPVSANKNIKLKNANHGKTVKKDAKRTRLPAKHQQNRKHVPNAYTKSKLRSAVGKVKGKIGDKHQKGINVKTGKRIARINNRPMNKNKAKIIIPKRQNNKIARNKKNERNKKQISNKAPKNILRTGTNYKAKEKNTKGLGSTNMKFDKVKTANTTKNGTSLSINPESIADQETNKTSVMPDKNRATMPTESASTIETTVALDSNGTNSTTESTSESETTVLNMTDPSVTSEYPATTNETIVTSDNPTTIGDTSTAANNSTDTEASGAPTDENAEETGATEDAGESETKKSKSKHTKYKRHTLSRPLVFFG